jgi:hypothetical protein
MTAPMRFASVILGQNTVLIRLRGSVETSAASRWRVSQQRVVLSRDELKNLSVGSSNRGRTFCYPGMQLGSHGDRGEMVTSDEFGVSEDKGRTQRKSDQRD